MRKINEIILHCSATPEGRDIKAKDIRKWHVENNHWSDIGYNYIIDLDGTIENGRPIDKIPAHCTGHNKNSIGICYIGGLDKNGKGKDTRTQAQKDALLDLVFLLLQDYHLTIKDVHTHSEYATKQCPCFSIEQFRREYHEAFD